MTSPARARLVAEHEAAVDAFARVAAAVSRERWRRAPGDGAWSPAQVVEHVTLAYEQGAAEIAGEVAGAVTTTALRRGLLRRLVLPLVLWTGRLPAGAPAPRVLRPRADGAPAGGDQPALLGRFRSAAERFAAVARLDGDGPRRPVMHPYFGPLSTAITWRLLTIHTRHHARRLARAVGAPPPG